MPHERAIGAVRYVALSVGGLLGVRNGAQPRQVRIDDPNRGRVKSHH